MLYIYKLLILAIKFHFNNTNISLHKFRKKIERKKNLVYSNYSINFQSQKFLLYFLALFNRLHSYQDSISKFF